MKFGEFPLQECDGLLLAHSLRLPDRILKKGRRLASADFPLLAAAGISRVTGAQLEADDVDENAAAAAVAAALRGPGIATRAAQAGRCNLYASERGLLTVQADVVDRLNRIDEAVTLATLPPLSVARAGAVVATVKIIPLAVRRAILDECAALARQQPPLALRPFASKRAALIVTEQAGEQRGGEAIVVNSSRRRLDDLGSRLALVRRCAHDARAVAAALREALAAGCSLILVAGSTVPKDRADVVPAGIVGAGGEIVHLGMPVEPGNMLLLAKVGEVPVIALPGCARSRRTNGLDWVLQRLLASLPLGPGQIMAMGVGGLIRSAPEPGAGAEDEEQERNPPPDAGPHGEPKVAALVLAAGRATRMRGANKLLQPVEGIPMVRRAVNAACASRCSSVTVVTGHDADAVRACLGGLAPGFAHNPDHASGMASSLRCGLAALPADADAVLVLLADMPHIDAGHIDRLLAAFDVAAPRIVVPMRGERRGNPILWPREFFAAMQAIDGDTGARALLHTHADRILSVAIDDDAILLDVDTPDDLARA